MPQCAGNNQFCTGSTTYTHLGLELIKTNQATYFANAQLPDALFPANDQTQFINILITDGRYSFYSTDAQVQTELEQMFAVGTTTYVIGFGDGLNTASAIAELQSMADWGSGGMLDYYDANNQADLEIALAEIVADLSVDPCCVYSNCSACPEPLGDEPCFADNDRGGDEEPDPVPSTSADMTTDGSTTDESTTDESTSDGSTTDGSTTATTDESTGDSSSGSSSESSSSGVGEDEVDEGDSGDDVLVEPWGERGCGCASSPSEGSPRGLAGSLVLLGLAGLVRRRRDHDGCGRDH
jgi:MYXO-CTERM domain-containing protein